MKAFALFLAYLACLFGLPAVPIPAAASGAQITLFTAAEAEAQATHAAAPASAAEDTEQKVICLTFDDGPTDSTTPKVLDILDTFGVRATFFLIGRQISGREDIVRRTAAAGHAVGIHTYSHVYREIYASPQALLRDIAACRKAIRAALPGGCAGIILADLLPGRRKDMPGIDNLQAKVPCLIPLKISLRRTLSCPPPLPRRL